ncbi:MAG: hypothetical protein LBH22_00060 [Bacteroidales bacterium]|jgi:hypothetical protein|nr:hypothetical protein [Bacteroidales bacterium]
MTETDYLNIVSQTDAIIDNLWIETIENKAFRDLVVKHFTTNDKINVYHIIYLIYIIYRG